MPNSSAMEMGAFFFVGLNIAKATVLACGSMAEFAGEVINSSENARKICLDFIVLFENFYSVTC